MHSALCTLHSALKNAPAEPLAEARPVLRLAERSLQVCSGLRTLRTSRTCRRNGRGRSV